MDFVVPAGIIENFIYSNFQDIRTTSSGEFHFNSPFVSDNKKRLYVNPFKSRYFDQKQQKGASFISFVAEYLDIGLKEAAILLIKNYSNNQSQEIQYSEIVEVHKNLVLPDGLKFFFEADKESRSYKIAAKYLRDRCIDLDDLGYVYDPNGDFKTTYHNRIIIPFYEEGRLTYYTGRAFDDSALRYKNPDGIKADNIVFQIDKLTDDVFIFEGAMDALSLDKPQVGTAMLSNKLSLDQIIKILNRAPKRIVFVTENDKKEEAIRIGKRNLLLNLKNMMKYRPPSLPIKFYIYNPPLPFKDFNELAQKTGKRSLDIETECVLWKPNMFDMNNFSFRSNNKTREIKL